VSKARWVLTNLLLLTVLALSEGAARTPEESGDASAMRPENLVYSVNRTPEFAARTARAVTIVTIDDIWRKNARTLPEVLMEEAGVFVQQTNYGSGSPIIRGLMGKEILILIDGVRINNAIFRTGPIQYLNTIDLGLVARIEIVRGVVSVLGSDALGGTINIITRKGTGAGAEKAAGRLAGRFSTADSAGTGRAEVLGRLERFSYLVGGTLRTTDNVTGGAGVGRQPATGYDEGAANAFLTYSLARDKTLSLSYVGLEQRHVPRTDRVADGTNLRFDFHPQRLQLGALAYQDLTLRRLFDSVKVTLFWNRQDEGRQEIRQNKPSQERRLDDRDTMYGLNLEMTSSAATSHRIVYGLDYSTERVVSRRSDLNLDTGAVTPKRGNFTDGAAYDALSVYVRDRADLGQRLTVVVGGRFNHYSIEGRETSSVGDLSLDTRKGHLTGAASAIVHLPRQVNLVGSLTYGFRALNIEDISVFDERPNGTEIPNPALQPERVLMYEAGVKLAGKRLSGMAFVYRSLLSDLLVRSAGTYGGLSFFDLNGNGIKDGAEVDALQRQNIGKATIQGVELQARYRLRPDLTLFGNLTATKGNDDRASVPLGRIPPRFGTAGVRWQPSLRFKPWLELTGQFAGAQRRLAPSDTTDSRIGPDGTDGFAVLTLRAGLSPTQRLRLVAAAENLTNEQYKLHASGLYRPGRQLVLGAEVAF